MRFNIRTLLLVTMFAGLGLGLSRSVHQGGSPVSFLYNCLTVLLAAAILILTAAIRRIKHRDPATSSDRNRRENAAVFAAVVGVVPFAGMWGFFLLQSFEARHQPVIGLLIEILYYATIVTLPVAIVTLAVSLFVYLAINENTWLFTLRVTCLLSSCLAMFFWSVANFPHL